MNPTLPPRRSLLLCTLSGDRRRGKVYERLAHKNSDTPICWFTLLQDAISDLKNRFTELSVTFKRTADGTLQIVTLF
jgi:hypothetical protein